MQYIWVDRMYRVQTAAYSRYITAFTINGTYETKPIMKTKPNSNRTQQLLFTFLQGIIFFLD